MAVIGNNVRLLREAQGLSLRELARRSGMTTSGVSLVEQGRTTPISTTVEKLARGLGVEPGELFAREEEESAVPLGSAEAASSGSAYKPRYSVPNLKPAETIEDLFGGHTPTVEEVLDDKYGSWEDLVNRHVDRWTEKLEAGNFTLGDINECWATIENFTLELNKLNLSERQALPPQLDPYGFPTARTGRAIHRLNDLFGPLHDAVRVKFGDSELEELRQKHADQRELFGEIAQKRTG